MIDSMEVLLSQAYPDFYSAVDYQYCKKHDTLHLASQNCLPLFRFGVFRLFFLISYLSTLFPILLLSSNLLAALPSSESSSECSIKCSAITSHTVLNSAYLAQQGLQTHLAAIRYRPNYNMEQVE